MNNPYRVIKKLAFVTGLCIVSCTTALAQQSLYIFLQSDNQPFYVQIADKVYSSSAIGHLVIPGLQESSCSFELGFPQNTSRPQRFSVPLKSKDHGYQLVKSGSDWALYDWQNQETIKPLKGAEGGSSLLYGERKKDDAFATLMAAVVNDSAVLYTSIVKKDAEPVPSIAGTTEKEPTEKQPVTKTEEKPVVNPWQANIEANAKKAEPAPVTAQPSTDSSARQLKAEPVTRETETTVNKPNSEPVEKDTLVTKYDPKETPLTKKPVVKDNVVKIQHQTKDGETKMVFVDSSESPANVVTVYINEEKANAQSQEPSVKPVDNSKDVVAKPADVAENAKKDAEKISTSPTPAKQDVAETVKPESPVKKEAEKIDNAPTTVKQELVVETKKDDELKKEPSKQEIAEQIKKETWRSATPEKKTTDTVTIILESRQMTKDTAKSEAPQPLYRPKQVVQTPTEPVKNVTVDTTTIQLTAPAKQEAVVTKPVNDKPDTDNKPVVKTEPANVDSEKKAVAEPAKAETEKKTGTEPVMAKKETEIAQTTQQAPKAVYDPKPVTDSVKKTVAEPETRKDTIAQKPDEPLFKPKPAEPEKKPEEKKPEAPKQLVMINSDCARFATDNDVDKLRVKMLAENDMQKRVGIANKAFKTMCLYAKQIKALSELFPTDENKFMFLQMAYPFAADTANFKQLYELFTDAAYQAKFKTMVHLQ
jgi:hypothetical protein